MSSQSDEAKVTHVGGHEVRLLPPDVVQVVWNGASTLDDVLGLFTLSDRWFGERRFFVMADQSRMTGASMEGRRAAATDPRSTRIAGLVILGASFQIRVMMTMMAKAVGVLSRGKQGRMEFVKTEAEALAWIEAERERIGLG